MNIVTWFHHLFNPHCPHCEEIRREKDLCKSCEVLERQLELEREHVQILLNRIANPNPVQVQEDEPGEELKPLPRSGRKFIPFAVREELVRQNDEKTLEVLKANNKEYRESLKFTSTPPNIPIIATAESTEALEKELLESDVMKANG